MCPKIIFMIIFFYLHENGFVHFKLKSIIIYNMYNNEVWLVRWLEYICGLLWSTYRDFSYKSDSPSRFRITKLQLKFKKLYINIIKLFTHFVVAVWDFGFHFLMENIHIQKCVSKRFQIPDLSTVSEATAVK